MANDRCLFYEVKESRGGESIKLADDNKVVSKGIGKVKVEAWLNGRWKEITIEEVRWVSNLKGNLFVFNAATKHGHEIITTEDEIKVIYKNQISAIGTWDGSFYRMKFRSKRSEAHTSSAISLQLLHEKMGQAQAQKC